MKLKSKAILCIALCFSFSIQAQAAYNPGGKEKLIPMVKCAATYAAASYAVRNFKSLKVEKGQARQQVADDFQRLSNILKYFATNSGYEEELKEATKITIDDSIAIIKMTKDFDMLVTDIESCDAYVDDLHHIYNE